MVLTSNVKEEIPRIREHLETLKQRFQEMERSASLGEILGGVAHEINNPLQIILGKAQILRMRMENTKDSFKSIEDLQAIEKGAKRIAELINSLNDLTLKNAEEKKLKTDVDLHYLFCSILPLIKVSLKDKKIELNLSLPGNLPKVKANPSALKELFLYLTLNAKQRINRGGKLEVSVVKEGDHIKIEFKDQGEGLSEEISWLSETSFATQMEKRANFGISSCFEIIREHKGEIRIESSREKGNSLTVLLPVI